MTLNEYQRQAMTTRMPSCDNDMYMLLGLVEEVGELAGKVSKAIRKEHVIIDGNRIMDHIDDGGELYELHQQVMSELGDVLWFVSGLAEQFGCTLDEVARHNLDKLARRKESNTIITHKDH